MTFGPFAMYLVVVCRDYGTANLKNGNCGIRECDLPLLHAHSDFVISQDLQSKKMFLFLGNEKTLKTAPAKKSFNNLKVLKILKLINVLIF